MQQQHAGTERCNAFWQLDAGKAARTALTLLSDYAYSLLQVCLDPRNSLDYFAHKHSSHCGACIIRGAAVHPLRAPNSTLLSFMQPELYTNRCWCACSLSFMECCRSEPMAPPLQICSTMLHIGPAA